MTKTILIIGARGMLGQDLTKLFAADGRYQTVSWDKEEIDITDRAQVRKKLTKLKPDIIINAAAYNAVDLCETDKNAYRLAKKINGTAVGYLARASQKLSAIFVQYSTDYVFDGRNQKGYTEKAKPKPLSKYGLSKYLGEQQAQKYAKKLYLIRTSRLFGPPTATGKKSFFATMLELAKKNSELKVVNEELSCFTYTPDLALATKKLVESKKYFGIYHLTNSQPATWYQAAKELFQLLKIKTPVIPVLRSTFPRPAKIPKYSTLLSTKNPPLRSYQSALKDYLKLINI